MDPAEDELRRLAINDERQIATLMRLFPEASARGQLDPRCHALTRLSALIAVDAAQVSLEHAVSDAIAQGVTPQDVVALLAAIAPAVGYPRVVVAAPRLATALGFDLEQALEAIQPAPYASIVDRQQHETFVTQDQLPRTHLRSPRPRPVGVTACDAQDLDTALWPILPVRSPEGARAVDEGPAFCYNLFGIQRFKVVCPDSLPAGDHQVRAKLTC